MKASELKQTFAAWQLNAAQGAKVLCLHTRKISEYLGEVERIPCAVAFHIEALNLLDPQTRAALFERRLTRKAHGG